MYIHVNTLRVWYYREIGIFVKLVNTGEVVGINW